MSAKSVGTVVLLAFVAVSVGYLIVNESKTPAVSDNSPTTPPAQSAAPTPRETTPVVDARPQATSPAVDPVAKTPAETAPAAKTAAAAPVSAPVHKVIAYYFHNTARCMTCKKIERLAEEALHADFAAEFESGELEWRVVNMEEPANEHFVQDYQLVASSLVLVDTHGGVQREWTNMVDVWQHVHDDEHAFNVYVTDQARKYLESPL